MLNTAHHSFIDKRCGLYDCTFFNEIISHEIARAKRSKKMMSLVAIRPKNENLLNNVQILASLSHLIQSCIHREIDLATFTEQNAFVIALFDSDENGCECVVKRLAESLKLFELNMHELTGESTGLDLGILYVLPTAMTSSEELIRLSTDIAQTDNSTISRAYHPNH